MSRVKVQGKHEYVLFDSYDSDKENPILLSFETPLEKSKKFTINDVTYKVIKMGKKKNVIIKMIKYKIDNTATSIVHKCPKKDELNAQLTDDKIETFRKKHGDKAVDTLMSSRVKLHSMKETKCPFCKVKFWKEKVEIPEEVQITSRVKGRKQLINRSQS